MIWSSKLFSPQVKIIRVSLGAAQILVNVLSFQAGWCIYNLYFPAVLSQGGLARCLLMCISRRLDDQRVIGAVGEGTEVHGRSRKTADYQPALATRYCTGKIHIKNTKPFSKTHNRAILIYVQLCMSARRRECKEKSKTNSVWSMTRVLVLMGGDLDKTGITLLSDPQILRFSDSQMNTIVAD